MSDFTACTLEVKSPTSSHTAPFEFVERFSVLDGFKHRLELNMTAIGSIHQRLNGVVDYILLANLRMELEANMNDSRMIILRAKQFFEEIDRVERGADSYLVKICMNYCKSRRETFTEHVQKYRDEYRKMDSELQDREKRVLSTAHPTLSSKQLDELHVHYLTLQPDDIGPLVETGQDEEIISAYLLDAVAAIDQRHRSIIDLEKQISEMALLFSDFAFIVDSQQKSIDSIRVKIVDTKENTEEATEEIEKAKKKQDEERKRKCCLLLCLIAVLVVILVPALAISLKNS
jgi:t-SNARE complex subunit (syntaxin)